MSKKDMDGYLILGNGIVLIFRESNMIKGQIIELWLEEEIKIKSIEFKKLDNKTKGYVI